jgi:tetratricopeptide (TPR) repeat protein
MTKSLNIIFFLLFLCLGLQSNAASIADTTTHNSASINKALGYQMGDYTAYFKEALSYIKKNDLAKGAPLLSTGLAHVFTEKKVDRIMSYQTYEVLHLIIQTGKGNLSKDENRLGEALIKGMFAKDKPSDKIMMSYLKQSSNSLFIKRVRLLFLTLINDTTTNILVDKLLVEEPKLISANLLKAEILNKGEQYEECIKFCDRVIAQGPNYAYAYKLKGDCYASLDQNELAVTQYTKAIEHFPAYYEAIYERAEALLDIKSYKAAIDGFRVINPSYKWVAYNLARAYRKIDMADSALYYINTHIKQNPDDGDGYDIKGDIYYHKNEYTTAINLYNQAIQLDTLKAYYYEDRGDAYFYIDSISYALKDFEKAAAIDTTSGYAFRRIGECYYEKKEYEKAINFVRKAIEILPESKYAFVSLNLCYEKLNKFKEAIEAGKKAVAIDSTYQSALGNLGWTYYRAGEYNLCIDYSYRALKYDKTATYAMFNIALATLRKGEFEKAKSLYSKFIKECKDNGYKVNDGVITDLNDLIDQKVMVNESNFIIKNILGGK